MESEEESQQEGVKPAAKNMSQQQERGGRPRGRPPLGSAGREDPSHIARRMPRSRGRNLTVTEFAKQLQGEGQTGKTTKKKVLKLAGRVLDPHVMSSSERKDESDSNTNASETSDPSMATRSSVRSSNTEAASVLSRKRRGRPVSNKASTGLATLVVEVDSLDSQSPGKRRKTTPEVKKGVTMLSASSRRQKVVGRVVNPHVMSGSEESGTTNTTDTESDTTDTESDATDTESDATDTLRHSPRKHSTATTQIRVSPRKHQKIAAAEEDEEEDAEYKQQRKVPGTRLKKSSNRVSETSGPSMATSSAHGSNTEAASVLSRKRRGRPASNKASTDLATLVVEVDSLDSQSSDKKRKVTQEEKKGVTHTRQSASRKQRVVGSVVDLCMMSGSEESGTSHTTDTESDTTDTESDATDTLRRSPRKHSTATTQIRVSPRKRQKIAAAEEDEEEDAEYKQQRKVPGTRSKESSSRTSETRAPSMATRTSAHGSNMKAASVLSRRQRGRPASNKASTGLATQSSVKRSITPTEVENGVTQIKRKASLRKQKVVGRVVNPHVMSSSEESDVSNATDTESDAAYTESDAADTESNAAATLRRSPRKHQGIVTAAAEEDEEEEAENKQQRKVVRTWSKESSNKVSKASGLSMAMRSSAHGSNTEADSALTRKRRARPSSNRASALVVEMDSDSHSSDKRRKVTPEVKKGVTHTRQSASSRKQRVVGRVVNPHVMSGSEESDTRNATDTESHATDTLRRSPRKHSTATTQIRVSPRKHQRTAIARTEEDKEKPSHLRRGHLAGKHSAGKGERRKVTPEVRKRVTRVTAF